MAEKIDSFRARRIRGFSIASTAALFFFSVDYFLRARLYDLSAFTGLFLLIFCTFLLGYNLRKKITSLPIGKSSTWLQLHIYVGFFSIFLFFIHTGWRLPTGVFETGLAALFLFVSLGGIGGLFLSRIIPPRLTERGGNIVFETIPLRVRYIREEASTLALNSIQSTKKSTIADFYSYRLLEYFSKPHFFWQHFFGSRRDFHMLLLNLGGVRRYCNVEELKILGELEKLVIEKDELDFQYTLQKVLKYWMFIHVPLAYAMVLAGLFHGILANQFLGNQ